MCSSYKTKALETLKFLLLRPWPNLYKYATSGISSFLIAAGAPNGIDAPTGVAAIDDEACGGAVRPICCHWPGKSV